MATRPQMFEIVPGKDDRDGAVVSVITKRSYRIGEQGTVTRRDDDYDLRKIDLYYDMGDPESATVQHEYELAAFKPSVDVVVIGRACAPGGIPVHSMPVSVRVGAREKTVFVFGNRRCSYAGNAAPVVTDPEPFTQIALRYERSYGGRDEKSIATIPFHYPRNPMGTGVVLRNVREAIEGLAMPNIEDPNDLLTPDRIVIEEPRNWHLQPLPQGFGWRARNWYPRCALLGAYPAFTDVGTVTAEERMGMLPKDHIALARQFRLPTYEAIFNNGAAYEMGFADLVGDEKIVLRGFSAAGLLEFALPGETPEITLDIGSGEKLLQSRLHTVSIRSDDREFDLVWRGALPYEGYGWWPKSKRLLARVN